MPASFTLVPSFRAELLTDLSTDSVSTSRFCQNGLIWLQPHARKIQKRMVMLIVANDFQIPFHNEKALMLFKFFLRKEKSQWMILNGGFQDF
jgi:hypothetical protein